MPINITTIMDQVKGLDDKALILEVVKAIGWEVSEAGYYAIKPDGKRFLLADPMVFGRCMLGSVFDLTSDQVQWRVLNEVIEALWFNEPLAEKFAEVMELRCVNRMHKHKYVRVAMTLRPTQLCQYIVVASRMRG